MKNKKSVWVIGLIVGFVLSMIGMMLGIEHGGSMRSIYGVFLFGGSILDSLSINRISRISYEREFPDLVEKEKIEYRDERNAAIRNRAKAKSADIIQWCILFMAALIFLVSDCPIWIVFVLVGLYFLKSGIEWYYTNKYQKEM
ncbi:hypothetical protein [Schaedlerella sp.]|uniref:hypothetical protein n=1 Tax=Schaedlerella sp. TaxID=2676057 RepID=UPI00265D6728|nr:hypothetical protein [uncultured Schaedlerella sp.]